MRSTIAALLFASGALAAAADEPAKYASKEGKFAVSFPADGTVEENTVKGSFSFDRYWTVKMQDKEYRVATARSNADFVKSAEMMEARAKEVVAQAMLHPLGGGHLEKLKVIAFGAKKYLGWDLLSRSDGNKVRTRFIFVGTTQLYAVMVFGPKEFADSKEAEKFLDSFEITE